MSKLNVADMRATNVQNRFRSLKRKRTKCSMCLQRTMVSVRLKLCQTCFFGEKLRAHGTI